jgi:uncharacterized iron-regulated membrane protein
MKAIIVIVLIAVLATLASAGVFMLKRRPPGETDPAQRDRRMARALALRVGISVALFLFILLAWWLGWIKPTGFVAGS